MPSLKNRKSKKDPPAPQRGRYRCRNHPERFPAVNGKCWECLLGKAGFRKKFGDLAEDFYREGGPGYAGQVEIDHGRKTAAGKK